jgi:hypothetical protein
MQWLLAWDSVSVACDVQHKGDGTGAPL